MLKKKNGKKTAAKITFRDKNEYEIQETNGTKNEFPQIGQQ